MGRSSAGGKISIAEGKISSAGCEISSAREGGGRGSAGRRHSRTGETSAVGEGDGCDRVDSAPKWKQIVVVGLGNKVGGRVRCGQHWE